MANPLTVFDQNFPHRKRLSSFFIRSGDGSWESKTAITEGRRSDGSCALLKNIKAVAADWQPLPGKAVVTYGANAWKAVRAGQQLVLG